ncbi:MAG TPA: NAD(P)-dependent oxidoreductase [Bryobacteraceae bacterium]|jgi:nucleoside-diphosphate-sugar epimerase
MKILIAGATGAIGKALLPLLKADGQTVIALTHSAEAETESIQADALDAEAVQDAIRRVRPDVIINELTVLPKHYTPEAMRAAAELDRKVRVEGNANLLAAARGAGVRRYILQSAAFCYSPGLGLADETTPFAFDASPGVAAGTRTYAELEAKAMGNPNLESVAVRYGFFYGPGTWFTKEGDVGEQVRRGQVPVAGGGHGVWSFVHIEDAAAATVVALHCAPGAYNIVNDEPLEQGVWLPAFARYLGAPRPPQVTEEQALQAAGADSVYYAMRLRGASNQKASRELSFQPRKLEWLDKPSV